MDPNAVPDSYSCLGHYTGMANHNVDMFNNSQVLTDGNKNWDFVKSREEYALRKANGEPCIYTCKENAQLITYGN